MLELIVFNTDFYIPLYNCRLAGHIKNVYLFANQVVALFFKETFTLKAQAKTSLDPLSERAMRTRSDKAGTFDDLMELNHK